MTKPSSSIGLLSLGLAFVSLSCTHPGYRNEVYPGPEGTYSIKEVPVTPSPSAQAAAPASGSPAPSYAAPAPAQPMAGAPAATPEPTTMPQADSSDDDPELSTVKTLWPRLSPSNRAAIVDLTRHLATPSSP